MMKTDAKKRYEIIIEEGAPHGGLFELEQTTHFLVADTKTGQVVMRFEGDMEASLSTSTGQWEDYRYHGVREVTVTRDGTRVRVRYHDGQEELVELPREHCENESEEDTA